MCCSGPGRDVPAPFWASLSGTTLVLARGAGDPYSRGVNVLHPTNLRAFALGYAAGVGLFFLVRALEALALQGPCRGHTLFELLSPLLLGPGGLALALNGHRRPGLSAFGLGLATASLFPALFFGAADLRYLQIAGCAPPPVPLGPQ